MKQVNGLSSTTSTKVQAITWKTAESSAKQTNLVLEHGVCYAVLSELSYWRSMTA
ncbi:hypothetical protein CROQUDRAFT_94794 [Cronartium quercuum f. sp. fusiforme G11]|uniref:Uncharacterized protein n=1 Tax=Cronartium quercuum f. sp. fusiforme G11 TaxID=708437 RepID=A0A9P6NJF8_9BASI|nr:hypothetical protein CROQUDRAFT_94794 [Cronartium quercuum f. sp. fusiforme G11]